MKTTAFFVIALTAILVSGLATAKPSQKAKSATGTTGPEQLLERAIRHKKHKRIVSLRTELVKESFLTEDITKFRQHALLLNNDLEKKSLNRVTKEQQVLAYLGAMANGQRLLLRVTRDVEAAVTQICKLPPLERNLEYKFLHEAERSISEACYTLLTADDSAKANELSLLAFNYYVSALSQGDVIPGYATRLLPGRSFLMGVIQGRFCKVAEVFCQ